MHKFYKFLVENKGSISGYAWSLVFLFILLLILNNHEGFCSGYDSCNW